jgi:iron complex outermembrane recepter protein
MTRSKSNRGRLRQLFAAGVAASIFTAPVAFAQTADQPERIEKITVTGSNIRRADEETPSPVQIIRGEDLKASGYTTVWEVLQHITANGQGTLTNGFNGAFAGGATGLSLRGLTTAYTLVLIDGHRMASYPLFDDSQRSFVDIANIPFDIVDRIEVLKDGASAVYGSDAIAGVVNIILKHNFKGATVTAEEGWTSEGGGQTGHFSVVGGMGNLDTDGWNAYFNYEYRHQEPILITQRQNKGQWSQFDWQSQGGSTKQPGILSPQNGITQPPTIGPYLTNPADPTSTPQTATYFPAPAGAGSNWCASYAMLNSGACAFINPFAQIQPRTQNNNYTASFTKKLGEGWTAHIMASYWDSQGQQYPSYFANTGLNAFPTSATPLVAVSAGVPPHIIIPGISSITIPANYPGNPYGAPAIVNGIIPQIQPSNYQYDSGATRIVADLTGSIAGWDITTAAGYTYIKTTNTGNGFINPYVLNADLQNDTFNILGGNPSSVLSAVAPTLHAKDTSELDFFEFNASRPVYKLQGGDMSLALGGEYIYRSINSPAATTSDGLALGSNAFVSGNQTNTSLYAELNAPVLKNLELDASVRGDHYDTSSGAVTEQGKFKWTVTDWVAIRGTAGTGFRAPNAAESGKSGAGFLAATTNDPILCPGGIPASGNIAAGSVIGFCSFQPGSLNTSNPGLSPEKSNSETLGIILEPVKGWSTTIDFYQIEIKNQIILGPPSATPVRGTPIQALCADGNGGTYTCTTSVGPILYYPDGYINANSTKTNGVEIDTQYRWKLGSWGGLTTKLDWSHTFQYILTEAGVGYELAGTHGPFVIGGDTANPRDRIQASATWDNGPAHVSLIFNWISGYNLLDPSFSALPLTSCALSAAVGSGLWPTENVPSNFCQVKSFLETDVSGSYNFNKHWEIHGSITNLFNTQPPVDMNTYGGAIFPYNPSMHQAGAVGRLFMLGGKYTF